MIVCHACGSEIPGEPFEPRIAVNVAGMGLVPHHERCAPPELMAARARLSAACDGVDTPEPEET